MRWAPEVVQETIQESQRSERGDHGTRQSSFHAYVFDLSVYIAVGETRGAPVDPEAIDIDHHLVDAVRRRDVMRRWS